LAEAQLVSVQESFQGVKSTLQQFNLKDISEMASFITRCKAAEERCQELDEVLLKRSSVQDESTCTSPVALNEQQSQTETNHDAIQALKLMKLSAEVIFQQQQEEQQKHQKIVSELEKEKL
jgi:hypothetical protein